MTQPELIAQHIRRDELYRQVTETFGGALDRLARAYEADPDKRRDLLQEIHLAVWRSLETFEGRCSLRTWVFRVSHNTGTAHVIRQKKLRTSLVSLEEVDRLPIASEEQPALDEREALDRLSDLIQRLKPLDRQIIVFWLEGIDAAATGEITGLSPANVAMKIHRIKNILKRWFHEEETRP